MSQTAIQTPATRATGTVAKAGPMMVVNPEREITDDDLADVAAGTGLNGRFVADMLAACATHERTGVSLYKSLEARTNNPAAKHRFNQFQKDSFDAAAAYDRLAEQLGIPVLYASPPARMTEAMDTRLLSAFLLSGSVDQPTLELKGIEAVLVASTICVANASLLASLAEGIDESPARTAMEETVAAVGPPSEEHLEWAATTQRQMVMAQASSAFVQKATEVAENVVGKVRDALGR